MGKLVIKVELMITSVEIGWCLVFFEYFSNVVAAGSYVRCVWLFWCLRLDNSRDCSAIECRFLFDMKVCISAESNRVLASMQITTSRPKFCCWMLKLDKSTSKAFLGLFA